MEQSWLCSICEHSPATHFCYCNCSDTLLCSSCFPAHFSKFPTNFHQNLPISARGPHNTPGYFERLQARIPVIESGKQRLLKDLKDLNNCVEESRVKLNQLIHSIKTYSELLLTDLSNRRADLERAVAASIEEVERTMYEEEPVLREKYSKLLRKFDTRTQMKLFEWKLTVCEDVKTIINLSFLIDEGWEGIPRRCSSPDRLQACWRCASCGCDSNKPQHVSCLTCQASRLLPSASECMSLAIPRQKSLLESKALPSHKTWTCICGFSFNLTSSKQCSVCGVKQQDKLCSNCKTKAASGLSDMCEICKTTRKLEAKKKVEEEFWLCIACDTAANMVGRPCWKCGKRQEEVDPETITSTDSKLLDGYRPAAGGLTPLEQAWTCSCGLTISVSKQKCVCGGTQSKFRMKGDIEAVSKDVQMQNASIVEQSAISQSCVVS